ncbi:MAG: CpaF family protein [Candidatus Omnitrophica bacterium]|nr:CpaF family protein [Candidatus Omnitrophota bacterium]
MADKFFELEAEILDKLAGRIHLMLSDAEREDIVSAVVDEISGELKEQIIPNELKAISAPEAKRSFITNFLSYGVIDDLLSDNEVEDIIINGLNNIYIHHSRKGLVSTDKKFSNQRQLELFIKKLLILSGRSSLKKIINFELHNIKGRVNICASPFGSQITITKAKVEPLSIIDLVERRALSFHLAAQLWLYIEGLSIRPANIIIAGGPGTGKTTLMNALFSFIPSTERIVVIEDTLELDTSFEASCSRLESDDDMSMEDLVKNSLRMRPDRVVVGEVRGAEAKDLMTAVNIGKNCLGTIHASTSREAILRLQNEPMNVPEVLVNLVDVFIITRKLLVNGEVSRSIEEVSETGGMEQRMVLLSQIWKYDFEHNYVKEISPSTVYRDRLATASGFTSQQIMNEVKVRAKVLEIMAQKKITNIKDVSTFCRAYNLDNEAALKKLGATKKDLLAHFENKH